MKDSDLICWFEAIRRTDVAHVGGKNASMGELIGKMMPHGIRVPNGFATTARAYRQFLEHNGLEAPIGTVLASYAGGTRSLREAGMAIRRMIEEGSFPTDLEQAIRSAYADLCRSEGIDDVDVAVRSSATAEDLPEASFAGQQESFLNISGDDALLSAIRRCMASLFTDRAIAYREAHGYDHMSVALSVGVQRMVRSDLAGAGVIFTIDTETGFPDVVLINAAWGLGESVVKGTINPDQYMVFKPGLVIEGAVPIIDKKLGTKETKLVYAPRETQPQQHRGTTLSLVTPADEQRSFVLGDDEILQLARWAVAIEAHYGMPMDIEWAQDGLTGETFIVQARPETVQSRQKGAVLKTYSLSSDGDAILTGQSVGNSIAAGPATVVRDVRDLADVAEGAVLVARMTDPDWVPAMRKAAAIVTDVGGRTCHAAIVSRELEKPAVVGTGSATESLTSGQAVTVSCAEGEQGYVYDGTLEFHVKELDVSSLPKTRTKIMLNLAAPETALRWWRLPADGIGLARMEFIITQWIKIHPMALVHPERVDDVSRKEIETLTAGYDNKSEYFVDRLARGIAKLAASQYPRRVILRTSDFKTNEYANLIGGTAFEPEEENPMLGWRGASRYYDEGYRAGFELECRAIRRVRETMGLTNLAVMIPFCRTVAEADRVLETMAEQGLVRGEQGLEIYVMCEIPSNVILGDLFAKRFDGFSIGSNDLTQLALGIDRDSTRLAYLFDERDETVRRMIRHVIQLAHADERTVGICGEAPSNYPDFVDFLIDAGIDSMSINPDSFVSVKQRVAEVERRMEAAPEGDGHLSMRKPTSDLTEYDHGC